MSATTRPDTLEPDGQTPLAGEGIAMRTMRVLAMVLSASGGAAGTAIAQSAAPPVVQPSTPTQTGLDAWERLKGNTITGKVAGQPFTEFFDSAGGVKYVDKDGMSTGTWSVQNTKVCFDFPEDDDRSCSSFTVSGTSGTAVDDDGLTTRFEIETGNSKGL